MLLTFLLTFAFGLLVGVPVGIWLPRSVVITIRRWHYAAAKKMWVRFGDETQE